METAQVYFAQAVKEHSDPVLVFSCSDMASHLNLKSHLNTNDLQILQSPFCTSFISICIPGNDGSILFFKDPASLNLDTTKRHVRTRCASCLFKFCPSHSLVN